MDWTQAVTIILTTVGTNVALILWSNSRTDGLYHMFIDLLKDQKKNKKSARVK